MNDIPDQRGSWEVRPPVAAVRQEMETAAKIEREFKGWAAWVGIDSRWRARRTGVAPKPGDVVTGEDPDDLRDMIRGWIGRHS